MGDFARHAETADSDRSVAVALAARLASMAVDAATSAAWQREVAVRERTVPRIDEVQVAGMLDVDEALVCCWLGQREGAMLDTATLTRDLGRAYGDGYQEGLD